MKYFKIISCLFIVLLFLFSSAKAQEVENEFQARTSITLSKKLLKNLKLSISPEIRFDDDFSIDKYVLEGKLTYKLSKTFSLGAGYRFYSNKRENKDTENYGRFSFSGKYEKKFDRFEPSLRIKYSNYSDDESDTDMLRYKAGLKYDIKNSKITPYLGLEAYHDISESEFYKMRYSAGMDYKLNKKNSIGIGYKFDYYINEDKNRHIISVGYKVKF